MIPIYTESTAIKNQFPDEIERCVFCNKKTRTWHENTNNPVCISCASTKKKADIPKDYGQTIRRMKRVGTFDRKDSVRAN